MEQQQIEQHLYERRKESIAKLEPENSYMGHIFDGGVMSDILKLIGTGLAKPTMEEYGEIIAILLFYCKTQPKLTRAIQNKLHGCSDPNSILIKLQRLVDFFMTFSEDLHGNDNIQNIEYRRLLDKTVMFTEEELDEIDRQYWKDFLLYSRID